MILSIVGQDNISYSHFVLILCMLVVSLVHVGTDGYYVAYKLITLPFISFMFIEMKFIYCQSCVMFTMKFVSICNDYVNYDEILIQ